MKTSQDTSHAEKVTFGSPPLSRLAGRVKQLRDATGGSTSCGHMYDPLCWLLFGLVRWHRPDLVIQTGHLWGKSALTILEALSEDPLPDGGQGDPEFAAFMAGRWQRWSGTPRLISVDPNPLGVPNPAAGIDLLCNWYPSMFTCLQQASASFFDAYHGMPGQRLFGVVDGDHSADGCLADLRALENLGADVIVVDDTVWIPALGSTTRQFAAEAHYALMDFPYYNGMMVLQA